MRHTMTCDTTTAINLIINQRKSGHTWDRPWLVIQPQQLTKETGHTCDIPGHVIQPQQLTKETGHTCDRPWHVIQPQQLTKEIRTFMGQTMTFDTTTAINPRKSGHTCDRPWHVIQPQQLDKGNKDIHLIDHDMWYNHSN